MTTWLEAVWWALAAACLALWAICLGAGVKARHGYRRHKLRQQVWDGMILERQATGLEEGDVT